MIEDQLAPKRCGHTRGKEIVQRSEALSRIKAAVDTREQGADILILARTDARATDGLAEALWRMQAFADLGTDILFLEAPQDEAEMIDFCTRVPGPKMANMLAGGVTPVLSPQRLREIGYRIVAYPLALLNSAVYAMQEALRRLATGDLPQRSVDFATIRHIVGFDRYDQVLQQYASLDPKS